MRRRADFLGEHLRPGFFQISDQTAGRLVEDYARPFHGAEPVRRLRFPRPGWEQRVKTPYGPAWLQRVKYPRYRRGWCWAVYGAAEGDFYNNIPKSSWDNGPPTSRRRM